MKKRTVSEQIPPPADLRPIKTDEIYKALYDHYSANNNNKGEYVYFGELSKGTGMSGADRRMDFWAMSCWSGRGRFAYEVKASRGDFLKELKQPMKRRYALLYSNYFYFIAPEGVCKIEEIPPECGLKVVKWKSNQAEIDRATYWNEERLKRHAERPYMGDPHLYPIPELEWTIEIETVVPAPHRDTFPPSWDFAASVMRRCIELFRVNENHRQQLEWNQVHVERLTKQLRAAGLEPSYD